MFSYSQEHVILPSDCAESNRLHLIGYRDCSLKSKEAEKSLMVQLICVEILLLYS